MKTKIIRTVSVLLLISFLVGVLSSCATADTLGLSGKKNLKTYYEKVSEAQDCLDTLADAIYQNWYDYVYNHKYSSIDNAVLLAFIDHEEEYDRIEELDEEIKVLFNKVKDGSASSQVKAVMSAYSDYYEFVVNVSGSFNSYSSSKESLKKALASALKNLFYEV